MNDLETGQNWFSSGITVEGCEYMTKFNVRAMTSAPGKGLREGNGVQQARKRFGNKHLQVYGVSPQYIEGDDKQGLLK